MRWRPAPLSQPSQALDTNCLQLHTCCRRRMAVPPATLLFVCPGRPLP